MMNHSQYDTELQLIADYVLDDVTASTEAYETACLCLLDSLGCAMLALKYPACTKLLGPIVPGIVVENGAHVPGTPYILDPVQAAFNFGAMVRWLDYNDTWLAAEWGHPSDNLGGILMVADYLSRHRVAQGDAPLTVHSVLTAMIKAYEIQGILALENAFNRVGLDHVILVKLATAAVVTQMLGGDRDAMLRVLSQVFLDGQSLRTYRHAPNTGSRKSWAAGDASSRGVYLAFLTLRGEMGYPQVLNTKTWGFCDVSFKQQPLRISKPLASYVMEKILFKVAYPAEFHAQTAVECALQLHPQLKDRLGEIEKVMIHTQESAIRIIDKAGRLNNPADRDHCLQYMVAIGLIFGALSAEHYEDKVAADERIDTLRAKMQVAEDPQFTQDYLDLNKRSIANALQIFFQDGTSTEKITIEYPLGHQQRREEALPLLMRKFRANLVDSYPPSQLEKIITSCHDIAVLADMPVPVLVDLFRERV